MKRKAPTIPTSQTRLAPRFSRQPLAVAVALALSGPVGAATITADGTNCTLIDAITAANTDAVTGGCTAGNGDDIIELTADITLTVVDNETDGRNGLPSVASTITVNGQGHTIARSSAEGTSDFRLLHVAASGNLTLNQVTLQNGQAAGYSYLGGRGGALFNRGTVALVDSTVSGNLAGGYFGGYGGGGGLSNWGTLTLTHSTVSGNRASGYDGSGGGLLNRGTATLTLINSTVSGNSVSGGYSGGGSGGGLYNSGTATLTHSTVSGNSADSGGGLFIVSFSSYPSTATLTNTLIANSTAGDCLDASGTVTPLGLNLIEDGSCGASAFPPGTDPQLGPLTNNGGPTLTHALLAGSPAIDAIALGIGGCGTEITTDQRGVSRPQPVGGPCDIGAFERVQALAPDIKAILDFLIQAVRDGELKLVGSEQALRQRVRALRHQLVSIGDAIEHGKLEAACGLLTAAFRHIDTDGILQPPEFVTGRAAPVLARMLQDLRAQLDCT